MKITKKDFGEIVKNFSDLIDKEKLKNDSDLKGRIGEKFEISEEDRIQFEMRPSGKNTMAYTMSYIRENVGIPIEVRLNPKLNYARVILKMAERLSDYEPFSTDPDENICQLRDLPGWGDVKSELKRIRKICE